VFASPETSAAKRARLAALGAVVCYTPAAITFAKLTAKRCGAENLRPSLHPLADVGFRSLAFDLIERAPEADAVVITASSGATVAGLAAGYRMAVEHGLITDAPRICPVQVGATGGFADANDVAVVGPRTLGVKSSARSEAIREAAAATGGVCVAVDESMILTARDRAAAAGLASCREGTAAIAAFSEVIARTGAKRPGVILTGHASQWAADASEPGAATIGDDPRDLWEWIASVWGAASLTRVSA
jgi:threonine synthase